MKYSGVFISNCIEGFNHIENWSNNLSWMMHIFEEKKVQYLQKAAHNLGENLSASGYS